MILFHQGQRHAWSTFILNSTYDNTPDWYSGLPIWWPERSSVTNFSCWYLFQFIPGMSLLGTWKLVPVTLKTCVITILFGLDRSCPFTLTPWRNKGVYENLFKKNNLKCSEKSATFISNMIFLNLHCTRSIRMTESIFQISQNITNIKIIKIVSFLYWVIVYIPNNKSTKVSPSFSTLTHKKERDG